MTPIAQIVLSLAPGGTERLVIDLCKRIRPQFAPFVVCLDEPGAWAAELEREGVPVVALGRKPGFHPSFARAVGDAVRERGAEVVHCHQYTPYIYSALARAWSGRFRLVFTEHGRLSDAPPSRKRRLANLVFGRVPAEICAVSTSLRDHMIEAGFPARRVAVVRNGIAIGPLPAASERAAVRAALGLAGDAFVVGTVARLDPVKDLTSLIAAFARLHARQPSARLVVVGDGAERDKLRGAAKPLGEAVVFTGQRDDARKLMAGFDVYANSSRSEGISVTLLEAMAAGVPIVATRVGGTPEVIVAGETGIMVPAQDIESMSQALTTLANDPAQRQAFAAAGRTRVAAEFTLDRMAADYQRLYRGESA